MKKIYRIVIFTMIWSQSIGQEMVSVADNDPVATILLDKLKAEYDTYKSMEVDFDLVLELPGQQPENQKGRVIQMGDKFKLDLDDRAIYSNGEYVWLHVKKNNEVQINDADMDDEAGLMSPKDMLNIYKSGEYVYAITNEPIIDGKKTTQIEFKPLDRDNEFSKLTLYIDSKSKDMIQMKVFAKDGGRYTLKINELLSNKTYVAGTFIFDEKMYPDVHVEDLRID